MAKSFAKDEEDFIAKSKELKSGWFSFKGQVRYDEYEKDLVFNFRSYEPLENIPSFKRLDNEPVKRVELHAHTMMSQMDGINACQDLIKRVDEVMSRRLGFTRQSCQETPNLDTNILRMELRYTCIIDEYRGRIY